MIGLYICAYALFISFFLLELFVRKGKDAKNMERTEFDRSSTTIVSVAMATAFILVPISPLLNYLNIGAFHSLWVGIVGVLLGVLGLAVRYLAFATLGRFFTRTLRETDEHALVTNGIYHLIRHPGYASDILIFVGAGLAMGNWLATVVVILMFVPAYIYRIQAEEGMLIEIFGEEYIAYQKKTKRIVPYLF